MSDNRPGTCWTIASSHATRTVVVESSHQRGCIWFHIDRALRP